MRRIYLSLLLMLLGFAVFGQTPYGNDWIKLNQSYYKVKVAENGIYRITASSLAQQNITLSGINPKNLQLFHKGIEVPIYVNGELDNSFDPSDYIEFYGTKNDGDLDKDLYQNPGDQPHPYLSLYSDTTAYFLTWSASVPGKRFQPFNASSTGLAAESFINYESLAVFGETYYQGKYIVAEMSLSDYIEGEGFMGNVFSKGGQQTRALQTPKLYTGAGASTILLDTYVAGRSNAQTTNTLGNNHHLRIGINNGISTYVKKDTLYKAYAVARTNFDIAPTEFGNTMQIIFNAPDDIGAVTDFQAPAFVKISYPRLTDLQGQTTLNFKTKGTGAASNTLLQFVNSALPNPILWDLTTATRIIGTTGATSTFVLSGNANNREAFIADNDGYKTAVLSKVDFINFNPSTFTNDFLIVTHKSMLSSAQNYAAYRTQTGYKPFIVTTDQLYDQFYYGVHHPLAIRNFAKYLLAFAQTKPQYLLLLGKGLENIYVKSAFNNDLVPTYGSPPADDLFTAHLDGANFEAAIPTGRIVAKNNDEVEIYLKKLKDYEQQPDSLWRKNFIHISGGGTLNENISWAGYQNNFLNAASAEFFGAKAINFQKFVNQPISANQKQRIIAEINKGVSLLSFFGHGSAQATEVDFGGPEELNNSNKLLVYLANGCTTGNPFVQEPSLSEKHILYPNKGAIGWIGTSGEGIAGYLSTFSEIFYRKTFNQSYGKSIAKTMQESKKQYQNPNDLINIMHLTQYSFQGDPALKFYNPQKPDYEIENKDLFIYPSNVTAVVDSFAVAIVVKNIGKALSQPLKISITRTLPDNSVVTYPIQTFTKSVYNTDTLYFYIKSNDVKTAGINKFSVSLDPQGNYDELSKANNQATLQYNMLVNGVNPLYPKIFSIIPQTNVELVAQSNNLLIGTADYIFEIDTVKTFDSNWKKNSGIITAGSMPKWRPTLTADDKKVYYWRVKLNLDPTNGGIWQESSFTYINQSPDGWNQSHYQQLQHTGLNNIELNPTTHQFEFMKSSFRTTIQTRGDAAPTADERTFRSDPGGRLGYLGYEFNGFTIFALKQNTFDPFSYHSAYNVVNDDGAGPYDSGQYYFNMNDPVAVDSLISYINQIPQGYYVIGFNGRNINLSAMSQAAKNAFATVGCMLINTIGAGEPYLFWGQKGMAPGAAIEKMGDPSSSVPLSNQLIKYGYDFPYPFDQGSYTSEKAGPSTKWKMAYYSLKTEPVDQISYDLLGYDNTGAAHTLQTNLPATGSLDISSVDAAQYPKLAIKASVNDATNRTPPQILNWRFTYDEYAETTINPEIKNDFYKGLVQEGDSIKWELALQNISKYPSDSLNVFYTLTKPDRSILREKVGKIETLQTNIQSIFKLKIPTLGRVGSNLLKLEFVPINGKDSYSANNYIQQAFTVTKDDKEPLVDVAFDGKHIINGEIVSPLPNIFINLLDENSYILLKDTTVLDISIKSTTGSYKRVSYSSGLLNFTPASSTNNNKASVLYKPVRLADGIYTLMVESKDASGNTNSTNDYTITFEVVNESAITHFYPYPNPFTTAMKFVYTLTGDKIPDKIKVQIMTITGKIVREVFKEELGAIRIGNNISDFTWDGTDQFGDRLANGVYFYKVVVENNDKSDIKHRNTSGDNFFKQNTGKIYLMR